MRADKPDSPATFAHRLRTTGLTRRLNLPAIEQSLLAVKREFGPINEGLTDRRDPLTDEVVANLLRGYRQVDDYLARGIDPLRRGQSRHMLELNLVALCGGDGAGNRCEKKQLDAAYRHFYDDASGVEDLVEWLDMNRDRSIWLQAAGLYTRLLSQPQPFSEGNHRTSALLMSHLLVQEGQPPFVLTVANARLFFEPASRIKALTRSGLDGHFRLPLLAKQVARQLQDAVDPSFLLAG
jgi:hypothetical protein